MPNHEDDIRKAKQRAIAALNIDEMGIGAYDIILQAIEDTFDFKAGKIIADRDFIKKLNQLTISILDLLQSEPKFIGNVSAFVKRMPKISDAISTFQLVTNNITVPTFETAKNIVIDETLDQMVGNGLNQHFVQPLRDLIYQNVTSGLSLKQAKENIRVYIQGGKDESGKLGRYIDQTAIQAVDSYSGAINKKLLETFDYDGLLITGSLIDNSSPQCRFAINELNGQITRDNWSEVVAHVGKNAPLIEGTTFDNLPVQRLHWGCRHSFYPILIKQIKKAA